MTTTFTIACTKCGQKFAGKPEYVGRRVKCPGCSEVFRVQDEPDVAVAPPAPVNAALEEEFDEWNVAADFEYKIKEEVQDANTKCKFCGQPTKPEEVLCMNCGYHRVLEKKIETKTGAEAFAEERNKPKPGHISFGTFSLPGIPLAIGGGVAASLGLLMLVFAPGLLALCLLLGGFLLSIVGHFWIIIVAFREDVGQGLLVWLLPIYWWVYVFSRWEETWFGFAITALGWLMLFFGMGILFTMVPEDMAEQVLAPASYFSTELAGIRRALPII